MSAASEQTNQKETTKLQIIHLNLKNILKQELIIKAQGNNL
jgi:hypothetical protein